MVTFSDVKNNKEINYLIESSQKQLDELGYTMNIEWNLLELQGICMILEIQ